ncbi:pyocin knob domain-containing protein [Oscillospiraceae bacterium 52-8]
MYTFVKGEPGWVKPLNENFEEVAAHAAVRDNPHGVTAEQAGAMPATPTKMLYQPTVTSGWDNADNYTVPGEMVDIPSATTAKSVGNLPCVDSGMLRVYGSLADGGSDLVQTYECYTVGGWWVRRRLSGVWSSWSPSSGIQSGSNANGSWTKFPDGTMICWAAKAYTIQSSEITITLPVAFAAADYVPTISFQWVGTSAALGAIRGITVNGFLVRVSDAVNDVTYPNGTQLTMNYICVGRWK